MEIYLNIGLFENTFVSVDKLLWNFSNHFCNRLSGQAINTIVSGKFKTFNCIIFIVSIILEFIHIRSHTMIFTNC